MKQWEIWDRNWEKIIWTDKNWELIELDYPSQIF